MSNAPLKSYQEAQKIWSTVVDTAPGSLNELKLQLEFHKRLLNIFQPGTYYYLIFSMYRSEFDLVSPGIADVLGYAPVEITVQLFMSKMHPDDMPYFLAFEQRVTEFYLALPYEKIPYYKVQYDFRIKDRNDKYVRILHQAVQVDYDQDNFYRSLVVHTDITHIKPEGRPCFSILGLDGEPSYHNIDIAVPLLPSNSLFSPRERQILKMIVEGKSSQQIADDLYISLHTVSTHRKNLLGKSNCKTPLELVSKAIQEGWV